MIVLDLYQRPNLDIIFVYVDDHVYIFKISWSVFLRNIKTPVIVKPLVIFVTIEWLSKEVYAIRPGFTFYVRIISAGLYTR